MADLLLIADNTCYRVQQQLRLFPKFAFVLDVCQQGFYGGFNLKWYPCVFRV